MLIEAKVFTALSNSLGAVRKNTGAIRKTLLNNRKTTEKSQKQLKLQEGLLKDQKRKEEREGQLEKKQGKAAGAFNSKKYFGKPERALDGPITGGLGGFLNRIVLFFSFTLLGWMLEALPKIIKAVKTFMSKAKEFMKKLDGFFGGVKSFAINISNAVGSLFGKITQNKDLGEGEETKVRDMISGMIESIMKFIKDLPERAKDMIMGLIGMHTDASKKIKDGMKEDEAIESTVKEYAQLSGQDPSELKTSKAPPVLPVTPMIGGKGFIQGGSGFGREGEYATHFHLSPPTNDAQGYAKARAVAFKAVRLMLERGSTVYFGNVKKYATKAMSDSELRSLINAEQIAHTQPGRTQGGIDIQEQEPGKPLAIPGQPGTASIFPLTTGDLITTKESSGGRMAEILGSGGVLIAHGAAGSTASDGALPASMQVDRSSTVERADTLASQSPKKKITIDKEIPIDVSKIRNKEKAAAFAAASTIKIEVVSVDGSVTPGDTFE